uniref:Transmembrane protein 45B n=1 Tax=Chlamydomonas leiostraca TaxID=1034604 RepID=A0A7S0RJJ5_9CHLO|mmetsp:Transcript_2439/g.6237  ORF Transcript_2439/g.6237 Transcript_2439/m.6237 type:complete len:352 (+) Transcript_2439:176-1231(+)|eukprot:CAMPEP_0202863398 /NCGR_PEP_ID=MMETSP1391-20130828/4049_1 /ASSEMBLY_ACC=CAM_ASM_000867 /TAXON_ID=1034604 /ORGANISM="Chlamydomonas leiostraca, Strain SAG 11-49" /LENGTH=351 /DNA_ID=CAMNT_0049543029 /DNA_START=114 /DNA_END=1169 /DNA_ORIENTATION=+
MDHGHGGMDMSGDMDMSMGGISMTCDGKPFGAMGYGGRVSSWSNHFLAGFALFFWALHWNLNIFKNYLTSSKHAPYTAQTTFTVFGVNVTWSLEGVLKITLSFIGIIYQLLGHGHWSDNVCEDGTEREGHFSITHMHSWENSWILFCFMVSGVVDVASVYLDLPPNTQHFFTAAAFGLNAFMLRQGTYVDMLDDMCYYLMFLAATGTALAMVAEITTPESLWAGVTRVYCTWMQAIWYFACARILYEGRPAWDTMKPLPDMGPAMYVPVVFVMWMNILSFGMLALYLGMRWWYSAHLNEHLRAGCCVERTLLPADDTSGKLAEHHLKASLPHTMRKEAANHELIPLVSKHT